MASKTAAARKRDTNPDFDAAYIELRNILAKHAPIECGQRRRQYLLRRVEEALSASIACRFT